MRRGRHEANGVAEIVDEAPRSFSDALPEWQALHTAADGESVRMAQTIQGALNALRSGVPATLTSDKDIQWAAWEEVVRNAVRLHYADALDAGGRIALQHLPPRPLSTRLFAEGTVDEHGHLHAPSGPGGGEFISPGTEGAGGATGGSGEKTLADFKNKAHHVLYLHLVKGLSASQIQKQTGYATVSGAIHSYKHGIGHKDFNPADYSGASTGAPTATPAPTPAPVPASVTVPTPSVPEPPTTVASTAHHGKLVAGDTIQYNGTPYTEKNNPWLNQFKGQVGEVVEGNTDTSPYAKVKVKFGDKVANVKHVDLAPHGETAKNLASAESPSANMQAELEQLIAQQKESTTIKAPTPSAPKMTKIVMPKPTPVSAGPMPDDYHLGKLHKGDTVEILSHSAHHYKGHYDTPSGGWEQGAKYVSEDVPLTGMTGTVTKVKGAGKWGGPEDTYAYVNVPGVMESSYATYGDYQKQFKPVGATAVALQKKWENEHKPKKASVYEPGSHVGKLAIGDIVEHEGKQYEVSSSAYHPSMPSAADVGLVAKDGTVLSSVLQHEVKPIKVAALDAEAKIAKNIGAVAGVEGIARAAKGAALGMPTSEGFSGISKQKGELTGGAAVTADPGAVKDSHETRLSDALRGNHDWEVFAKHLDANGHLGLVYGPKSTTDLDYRAVSNLIQKWAGTSTKTKIADFMQQMANEEFELGAKMEHINLHDQATIDAEFPPHVRAGARAFLREMYVQTQKEFAARGVKDRVLLRRMNQSSHIPIEAEVGSYATGGPKAARVAADLQPMNSFSNKGTLHTFGSHMYMMKVPASRIISTSGTGYGCLGENEYVVLGGIGLPSRYSYTNLESLKHGEVVYDEG
jgi:hypothetical protein